MEALVLTVGLVVEDLILVALEQLVRVEQGRQFLAMRQEELVVDVALMVLMGAAYQALTQGVEV